MKKLAIVSILLAVVCSVVLAAPWGAVEHTANGGIDVDERYGTEISDPAAPAANVGVCYFKDNGSGKTQMVVRFNTGAVQVIATEP